MNARLSNLTHEEHEPRPRLKSVAPDHEGSHSVQFYKDDSVLLEDLNGFIGTALMAGNSAIVVATRVHREGLSRLLSTQGIDVNLAAKQGRYIALDAYETLSKFMVNDVPDETLFKKLIGNVLSLATSAAQNEAAPAVFGEMVALLWQDGKTEAAIRLEQLWNDLAKTHQFHLRCAYPMSNFNRAELSEPFLRVCEAHSLVVPSEGHSVLKSDQERLQDVANLEQKLEALTGEMALRVSEERFRHLVEAVRDYAIFMLDTDGRVSTWNQGAERIKGYKASEIIGKHFSQFYPEEDVQAGKPQNELEIAVREGRVEDEGWRVRKDGSKFWATVVISAMHDDDGNLIGFSKVTKDNTERMLVLKSLRDSRRELHDSEDSLRRLSLHLLRTQDEERRRIGRDLHDSLGQTLSVLKMKLDSLPGAIGLNAKDPRNQNIAACANLTEDCIKEVRTIAYLLYPPMLEEMGLKSAISWYVDGFSKRSGIQTTFETLGEFGRLPRHVETAFFRVLQESLTNVHRHSGSKVAHVRLYTNGTTSVLEVIDEGKGLPAQYSVESSQAGLNALGVGLRGMEERMHQLGGELELVPSSHGTKVIASVPTEAPSMSATSAG
jgi:PAS domain S-box-containing protein